LRTRVAGLDLPNPVGMAAGFDKDAMVPDALLAAGFGFSECGTLTPRPQAGNPKPRLFRLPADGAVLNRMGFNNQGLDRGVQRLAGRAGRTGVVGANIGPNKDSPDRIADLRVGLAAVWPHVAYVTVNISSPNTPGLRGLQSGAALQEVLAAVAEERDRLTAASAPKPVFLKLAPDLTEAEVIDLAAATKAHAIAGLILGNTTASWPDGMRSPRPPGSGGLSGRPLAPLARSILRQFRTALGPGVPLIAAGGIGDGAEAYARIRAGASAVQLYTAVALQGPGLIAALLADLAARLAADGFRQIGDAVGVDA
jgi:dihydroorotate dehydrogenase